MERLGIYKNWLTEKTIVKYIDRDFSGYEDRWEEGRQRLESYSRGENPFVKPSFEGGGQADPPFFIHVESSFICAGRDHAVAMRELFSHRGDWKSSLKKCCAYNYWKVRIGHRARKTTGGMSFRSAMWSLAECLVLGWMEQAKPLTEEVHALYRSRLFYDVEGEFSRPLYHWLLRICFDHFHLAFDGWGKGFYKEATDTYAPPECFSELVLNELFEHWHDEDLTPLNDHLVWLCDYYTHRTRQAQETEFGSDLLHARFPALILAWFRLREQRGLSIPNIDHPLMHPSYARLPSAEPFYTDDLLERVLARLRREEIPDLGAMPREAETDTPKRKSGWLERLVGRK